MIFWKLRRSLFRYAQIPGPIYPSICYDVGPWTIVAVQCGRVDSCQLCSVVSWSVRGSDWYTALCTGRHYKGLSTGGSHTSHTHTHTHTLLTYCTHFTHTHTPPTHTQRCDSCREVGATVGCCTSSCSANFHFQCARDAKSVLYINGCSKIPFNATVHVIIIGPLKVLESAL